METQRLSKQDLMDMYPDAEWRRGFLDASRLSEFLANSVLKDRYKIPDEIVGAIQLTEAGGRVLQKLITKNEVPPKEARLLCFLRLVHREPLVDIEHTDLGEMRRLIDKQIRDRDLLFPFVLGRELYDQAAELYDDERDSLSHVETLRLLNKLPIGVFQVESYVTGPYGLLISRERRWFGPTLAVPMYHCSELTCSRVHTTRLSTDYNAPINQQQQTMDRVLESFGADESEWAEFMQEIAGTEGYRFDDRSLEPLFLTLGDQLADDELRALFAHLLDNTAGRLRKDVEPLALVGKADDIAESLDRAGVIQLLLLATNEELIDGLDALILATDEAPRRIRIEPGEIRRLMVNRRLAYGTFGTYPELSVYGVRFTSDEYSLGPMRLKRLVEELYDINEAGEVDELQWQLRTIEGDEPPERLEEFVRSAEPNEVIERLILSRRTNLVLACERLGLRYEAFAEDDSFVQAVLWKLGFYKDEAVDLRSEFWVHYGRLKSFCQTAGVGARVDAVELRSKAANYFVGLEGVLDDALSFATWALTSDHIAAERPFDYVPERDRRAAFNLLNSFYARSNPSEEQLLRDKNTLQPLINGFGVLADYLSEIRANSEVYRRPAEAYPRYSNFTDLKKFPFAHTVVYLDLLERSQERVVDSVKFVRETLDRANVANIRNEHMHYRATSPDLLKLDGALEAAEKAVSRLEADGLCRTLFRRVSDRGDNWGRRVFTLRSAKGTDVAFARPSAYDWSRMPSLSGGPQYIMPAAVFAQPNEMLRFRQTFATSYAEYWRNYPLRRAPRGGIVGGRVSSGQEANV